ncbi:MAG: right-handed parallel beta-helix repeat-containing protein [Opitutae bacterium]|nr:right-handed parallel beta-helix repeat-containing protein [Opitutae bacterium]
MHTPIPASRSDRLERHTAALRPSLHRYLPRFFCVAACAVFALSVARADYYVAPTALGTGAGTSAANAADYLNTTAFWPAVQTALASGPQTVWFANSTTGYTRGTLELAYMGHPVNTLTLRATTDNSVTLKADGLANILFLKGTQNVVIRGFNFEGTATDNGLMLWSRGKSPCRKITVMNCIFQHLTACGFGAISPATAFDVLIDNCTFYYNGIDPHFHCVYTENSSQNVTIQNCTLTNSKGEYVRFRNDSDYGMVNNCHFLSTSDTYNAPFISVVLYNTIAPAANEFFSGNFVFTNNTFKYTTTGVPNDGYGAEGHYRYAHYFYNSGFETPAGDALQYYITAADATTLNTGTAAQKNAILKPRMELDNARIKIYGNSYDPNGYVATQTAYRCYPGSSGFNASGYSTAPVNISNWPGTATGFVTAPMFTNGTFEALGSRLRKWVTFSGNAPVGVVGFAPVTPASLKAVRLARTSNTEFGHWIVGSYTATPQTIHWLMAVGNRSGTGVKAKALVYHNENTGARLEVAINDLGQVGYMNGATFVPVAALGTIAFSNDANADGDYIDAGDTLNWYQFRVVIDYSTGTPHFDIARGNANTQSSYVYSASGITSWVGAVPVVGSKIGLLSFANFTADLLVDEVW